MVGDQVMTDSAPSGRRAAAWGVDFALVLGFAALLGTITHYRITDYLSGWVELGGTGAWDVLQSNGDWGGAGKTFGMDVVNSVLMLVIQAFAALVVATFVYQFVGYAWKGQTFGKVLLDLRVRPVQGEQDRLGRWQAARRALSGAMIDVGLYSCACIALLAGRFVLSVVLWIVAVVVLAVDAVFVTGARRRSLVDRFAGTVVVQAGLYRKSLELAREHDVVGRGITAARAGVEQIQVQSQRVSRFTDPEQLRQLRESERARQLRDLGQDVGRRTTDTARQAIASERGQQAQRAAKLAGASLKGAIDKRRGSGKSPV